MWVKHRFGKAWILEDASACTHADSGCTCQSSDFSTNEHLNVLYSCVALVLITCFCHYQFPIVCFLMFWSLMVYFNFGISLLKWRIYCWLPIIYWWAISERQFLVCVKNYLRLGNGKLHCLEAAVHENYPFVILGQSLTKILYEKKSS